MTNIFLIETVRDGLRIIKSYLSDNNLNYMEFSSVNDAIKTNEVPMLIILLVNKNLENFKKDAETLKNSPAFSRIPRIFILPFEISGMTTNSEIIYGEPSFQIPVDKLKFLSTVSRFLKRSPRRVFRILITILAEGSNIRYSGISIDFSETGMAFECNADFPGGHKVKINFVNPRNRKRFLLQAEIVRKASTQPGGSAFYGVKFRDMTDSDIKELMGFITGES
ncbi:MAG: PilZ domain-containing protein [Nitrospirota bacterium]